ncbi:MAG: DoxX family protein [Halorientalis sp.]
MDTSALIRDPREQSTTDDVTIEVETPSHSLAFLLARFLYGGVLTLLALGNFRHLHQRIGYAQSKDAPKPELTVPFISGALLSGSLGIVFWRVPTFAAGAVASFLVAVTPQMHDFWAVDDPDERSQERIQFLKNTALLGGALAFMLRGSDSLIRRMR